MAGKISRGVTSSGAIAYQDDATPSQFHYFPSAPRLTMHDNLEAFSVHYWGIGNLYFSRDPDTEKVSSRVGAIMSGQVIYDLTGAQKSELERKITEVYGIAKPQLLPLYFRNVEVTPVFAGKTLGLETDGDARFPRIVQGGSSATFNVSNGSGKFAQLFANVVAAGAGSGLPNPDFALNITGDVELVADPWRVLIKADLSAVWKFVREQVKVNAQIGWINLGDSEFSRVMEDMQRKNIVTIKYIEGSYDSKDPGNQLFEQGKLLFEAVNAQLAAGTGLFKLEPNPKPPEPPKGGGSVLPWSFSVNGAYQSSFFSQKVEWSRELEYSGRTLRRMPSSIVLAVTCGKETEQYFYDLGDPDEPCITSAKIKAMSGRLKKEMDAQNALVGQGSKDVANGTLDPAVYSGMLKYLETNSITEDRLQKKGPALARVGGREVGVTRHARHSGDYRALLPEIAGWAGGGA